METESLYIHLKLKAERQHAWNPTECPLQPTQQEQKELLNFYKTTTIKITDREK